MCSSRQTNTTAGLVPSVLKRGWASAQPVRIAVALPSTPGHVGAFELGGVVALRLLHVSDARALAFALLYHLVQILPVMLVGLLVGWREIWRRS